MPLDEVIYCDIRFDEKTNGETPEMAKFIPEAEKILKDAHVLTLPGNAFGKCGEGHLRICCTVSIEVLKEAFDRIEKIEFGNK